MVGTGPGRRDKTRVLIAGGGVAAVEGLLALRALAGERLEIELLAPRPEMEYRPLAVTQPFDAGRARTYDLHAIAKDMGAGVRLGALGAVRPGESNAVTRDGTEIDFDVLFVAVGATPGIALPGAITLKGPRYTGRYRALLAELKDGRVESLAFAAPAGAAWVLPLYELALLTADVVAKHRLDTRLSLVTHEAAPLELFGQPASSAVRRLLEERGIELHTARYVGGVTEDGILMRPGTERIPAARVVSMPRLGGPWLPGLSCDREGFIRTDRHGLVEGTDNIYAAGDAIAFPVKQGGLATQQADAAAESIAARAGASVTPRPFRPLLRGMLLTGGAPRYMRAEISGGRGESSDVAEVALWWPPSKIAGRFLSPYLGIRHEELEIGSDAGVPVEVELEEKPRAAIKRRVVVTPRADVLRL